VCGVIGLLVPSLVRADVGVQPVLPGGSSIKPEDETPIQMAAEIVTMNIRPATEADNALVQLNPESYGYEFRPVWYAAIAEVEADFTMRNPTSELVSMTVWFPLASALENADWQLNPDEIVPRIESFQVSVDDNPVDYAVSELPNPKGTDKPPLPWASFPVTFPDEKVTVIHVSYMLPLQPTPKGNDMALYYIFQTGAGWAGAIEQAELVLNLPYPASTETLADTRKLDLPPMNAGQISAGTLSEAMLEGNQARWTWKEFEPGPEDDFSVWLLQPTKWQELETARAAVQTNPEDGQTWLDLASTYHSLSVTDRNFPLLFGASYLPQAIEAYQKAADLLPEHPAPHAGLALLTLAPYMKEKNAPPEVIQFVQEEYEIATALEAKNPTLALETGTTHWLLSWLEEALYSYDYNNATATAESAAWSTEFAKETTDAALQETPSATLTQKLTLTATPIPSTTHQPTVTTPPTIAETTNNEQSPVIFVLAGGIGLVIVGYLSLKRLRKSTG
jgi:tetratricopeptide (TPR) repeat protein